MSSRTEDYPGVHPDRDGGAGDVPPDSNIAYHLRELAIAQQPESSAHAMPEFSTGDRAVLDIGCGIGQTLVASRLDSGVMLVGLDIDLESLAYGRRRFGHIQFVDATAERLPFRSGIYDLVISRVGLPYTNIPHSLAEIARVLKGDGRVWFTLHPLSMTMSHLAGSIRRLALKDVVYRGYVVLNGLALHVMGRQFPFVVKRKFESCQTIAGMTRAMRTAGFSDVRIEQKGPHLICTGRKRG